MKKSDLSEFEVEEENFKLKIKRDTGNEAPAQIISSVPLPAAVPATPPAQPASGEAQAGATGDAAQADEAEDRGGGGS